MSQVERVAEAKAAELSCRHLRIPKLAILDRPCESSVCGPLRCPAEVSDRLAVDVFIWRDDAFQALEDAISDEPSWTRTLLVVPIELDEREIFSN
jgi:hypothetical protein